jgi:hypothetical protein
MRIIFLTKNKGLNSLELRVREEGYETKLNPDNLIKEGIKVTDFSQFPNTDFTIGAGIFHSSLDAPGYNKYISSLTTQVLKEPPSEIQHLSCWFNGIDFVYPPVLSIPYYKLMDGNLGPETPSMGCVLERLKKEDLRFASLLELKPILRKVNYMGMITLEGNANKYFQTYRILPYFQYDLLYAFYEGVQEEIGRGLHEIAQGIKREFNFPSPYTIAIRISIPPYPYPSLVSDEQELIGYNKNNKKHIWLQDVTQTKSGVSSNKGSGNIATITARGKTVRECMRRAYRTVKNLSIKNMQYRHDIGSKFTT